MTDYLCPYCGPHDSGLHHGSDGKPYVGCYGCGEPVDGMTPLAEAYKALKAENEALKNPWQPIDSAPKDGTKVFLALIKETKAVPDFGIEAKPPHVWWCVQGFWSDQWENWNDGVEPCGLADPNFWMPVPPPNSADRED